MNKLTVGETLVTILYFAKEYNFKLTADRPTLSKFFYDKRKILEGITEFDFVMKDYFPESDYLDQSLMNMCDGNILIRFPDYYRTTEQLEEAYNNYIKLKIIGKEELFTSLGKELVKELSVP